MKYIISGSEIHEFRAVIEANSEEEAEEIFLEDLSPDLKPWDRHSWMFHDTEFVEDEDEEDEDEEENA